MSREHVAQSRSWGHDLGFFRSSITSSGDGGRLLLLNARYEIAHPEAASPAAYCLGTQQAYI